MNPPTLDSGTVREPWTLSALAACRLPLAIEGFMPCFSVQYCIALYMGVTAHLCF